LKNHFKDGDLLVKIQRGIACFSFIYNVERVASPEFAASRAEAQTA
jgi:hypothetical protein